MASIPAATGMAGERASTTGVFAMASSSLRLDGDAGGWLEKANSSPVMNCDKTDDIKSLGNDIPG